MKKKQDDDWYDDSVEPPRGGTSSVQPFADGFNLCLERMHYVYNNYVRGSNRVMEKLGLGRAHHRVLYFIARGRSSAGTGGLRGMAQRLGISKQALHKTLRELIEHDLAVSEPNPANKREHFLKLTPKGLALEELVSGIQRRMFAEAAARHGNDAIKHWASVMDVLATSQIHQGSEEQKIISKIRRPGSKPR
ncbi:MAG TPA: MarR family winged helix-turn-helix transcriptional regulator [Magnetospirillaceae bacterium]|jgi:DNA-binding MarR family transcriptional regulator